MLNPTHSTETARNTGKLTSRRAVHALVGALLILIAWGLWRWQQPVPAEYVAAPVKVAVAAVSNQPFIRYLEAIGELEAVQEVSVPAEIGGRIVELPIESGQYVARGQVLEWSLVRCLCCRRSTR